MRKNKTSVIFIIALMLLVPLIVFSCKDGKSDEQSSVFLSSVKEIEKELSDSISTDKEVIKIIAFNTYKAQTESEVDKIKKLAKTTESTAFRKYLFASDGSFYRVYFPVSNAIVRYEQRNITTDAKGALIALSPVADITALELAGKYRELTEEEKEAGKERPVQMLRTSIPAEKKIGTSVHEDTKICVFYLGERKLGDKISW